MAMRKNDKSIEDQPRYQIDDSNEEEKGKETKILSEEQSNALQKLIKHSGHILEGEEREILFRLQDKLDRETDRVKSLKKVNIKDKPLDDWLSQMKKKENNNTDQTEIEEEGEEQPKHSPKIKHVVGFKPSEVVKQYIECWNQQKFGAEYDCFSPEFMTTDRETYINARQKFYQQQYNQGGLKINFGEVLSSDISGNNAEVIASKTIQQNNKKPQEEQDLYRLKLIRGRWLINHVEQID